MALWSDLVNDALFEIGAYGAADPIDPADTQLSLRFLNRIIDAWSARRAFAWSDSFQLFTLTPNHAPHLIGPGLNAPDFNAPRPVRIEQEGAALVLNTVMPAVDLPLNVRDADWWNNQRVKGLATNVPTDVYYEADNPSGALNFWPVPNFAYQVRLRLRNLLTQVTQANLRQSFAGPPGYELALMLTLAEYLCTPFTRPVPAELPQKASRARAEIQMNNIQSPRISSADYGTSGQSARGDFNYYRGY